MEPNIYIGWDPREDFAYQVCKFSIERRSMSASSSKPNIIPLKQSVLREQSIYNRPHDSFSSTEFTFTRFLVPYLNDYKGWALFCDCDILFMIDVNELFSLANDDYAVMVVQHQYTPTNLIKMDGKQQFVYPRKNWSSVMLFNCAHPANRQLNLSAVNTQDGQFLHRFQWLDDSLIGNLPPDYNWLSDWYKEGIDGTPKIIHYTTGGPWFPDHFNCPYHREWKLEAIQFLSQ